MFVFFFIADLPKIIRIVYGEYKVLKLTVKKTIPEDFQTAQMQFEIFVTKNWEFEIIFWILKYV